MICLGLTIWALFFRGGDDISPDYPPQGIESNQTPIDDDDSGKLDSPEGGGAINVTYGTAATVDLSGTIYENTGKVTDNGDGTWTVAEK